MTCEHCGQSAAMLVGRVFDELADERFARPPIPVCWDCVYRFQHYGWRFEDVEHLEAS